ncbi:putative ABC-type nitrate/sulfonate/bicarbonate transport systems, periplasmic component [Vibrio nigripulchritudo SFn27]|uniref:Putative ABC-type nitrate/sulfonate/bicarbonate transport systems, periplasmic component n=1 Tax=Vibrio nigripulchritudo TaxID=28173 RepID=U4KHX6_9VIBR|nr:PhnD/SsuA/transferrin family substrate-binding protein [Vibrio nigripulchritudo]CCN84592.1 putative ABC-type nitrate/sulfonate/bicarbonate transport systems, periplasmic component [Vibrio nigripulchritudo BLFn1]CCN90875.1 putative ABC-type nitrate/sulfonate/bicarbonate transport systems, periplasmic component [Vibrio nigripulchritudo SFn27]CCN96192.1 putative ABC-type nitrate/sulfonate/bicarbonate transport systems, periplasmic component [Vibrio nigripulchritudo ENn2]CCO41236.1 putative ABC-
MNTTRRAFLRHCGLAGAAAVGTSLIPAMAFAKESQKRKQLTMYGPPVGPSVTLAHSAETNAVSGLIEQLNFETYRNPDVLRTNFVAGRWELAGTPSYVAANLYNKGVKVRLMNIMTWGLLYVISVDENIKSIEALKGQDIVMPFKADMPDLVFQHIAKEKGMKTGKDYRLNYVGSPFEGLQLLLSGRAKHAVLPEPAATAALLKGLKSGTKTTRVIDLQSAWGEVTDGPARIPQAGMMVSDTLLDEMPDLPERLNAALTRSTDWVVNNTTSAGRLGESYMTLKAPIIERSIPFCNFGLDKAKDIQQEIESFYSILAESNPAIIGGKLPPDDFYLG